LSYSASIPYTEIIIHPRGKSRRKVFVPIVHTCLFQNKDKSPFRFQSIVDSGSDFCIFPSQIGDMCGIDVKKGRPVSSRGIGGKEELYFHKIKVGIIIQEEMWEFESEVGFSGHLIHGLLGRRGFFDLFAEVSFNEKRKMFRLKGEGMRPSKLSEFKFGGPLF
jgi:hypothetical protein